MKKSKEEFKHNVVSAKDLKDEFKGVIFSDIILDEIKKFLAKTPLVDGDATNLEKAFFDHGVEGKPIVYNFELFKLFAQYVMLKPRDQTKRLVEMLENDLHVKIVDVKIKKSNEKKS